ncbi:MAG: hypothetical protein GY754_10895 [bacterium]|nr:hypothetical protein [bacterium]
MYPYCSEMDKNPPQYTNERIVVNPIVKKYMEIAGKGKVDLFLADAILFLEFSGIICIAWQWLIQGLAIRLKNSDGLTLSVRAEHFDDLRVE